MFLFFCFSYMKDVEIEIQVKLGDVSKLLEFLKKHASFKGEKHQVDEYFSPAHRKFLDVRPVKEWLRLRDSDGKYSINYKNWYYDANGKSDYGDEYESKLENSDSLKKILKALNFSSLVIVDKNRKIWVYKDYEVAIDSVKGLGEFVEIEFIGE